MKRIGADQPSLAEMVFEEVRSAIVTGQLEPGSRHSVVAIADQLGVSRTPVREALLQLASHGMVRFERNRGVLILKMSPQDIREIFEMRIMLEVPSVAACVRRITADQELELGAYVDGMRAAADAGDERSFQAQDTSFHGLILDVANNDRIKQAVANTRGQMAARSMSTTQNRTLHDILKVHQNIFSYVEKRDADGASGAMLDHLTETAALLLVQSTGTPLEDIDVQVPAYVVRV